MSDPKMQHIQGDVNISPGLEASLGTGSLYITGTSSIFDIAGETFLNKTNINTTNGLLSVTGTNKVSIATTGASGNIQMLASASSYLKASSGTVEVQAQAGSLALTGNSTTLISDTTTVGVTGATGVTISSTSNNVTVNASANFDVNASAAITMDANAASNLSVSGGGNLTLESSGGRAILEGGSASSNAVTIRALAAAGGVNINAGTAGFNVLSTDGPFSIDAQNVASNLSLATNSDAQDLTIALTGVSNSSIDIHSSGTGTDAVKISALSVTGGIDVNSGTSGTKIDTTGPIMLGANAASNFTTTGAYDLTLNSTAGKVSLQGGKAAVNAVTIGATDIAGGVAVTSGTGGVSVNTTAGFAIDSNTTSHITLTGTSDFTINNTAGKMIIQSAKASSDAVRIYSSNAVGGISMASGSGGIAASSQGTVMLDAVGAASHLSLSTNAADQDLTIAVTGVSDSSLNLLSSGTNLIDAINITASSGGINASALGEIRINTVDTINGIHIGTVTAGVPITIGTPTSRTVISGNLTISGTTTTINTETLVVSDNIIFINSGNGELGADGGMVIRRNQTANNTGGGGDVVLDSGTGVILGSFQAGSATPGTLVLNSAASAVDQYYSGWWIKITSGSGVGQIRRIASYVGSTRTATIYITSNNTVDFIDGLNLVSAPAVSDTYSLYNSPYIASFYNESADRWTLAFTNITPNPVADTGISTVNIQRYAKMDSGAITIQSNGVPGDSVLLVNNINEFTSGNGVTISGVNINNGLIGGATPDTTEIVLLPDNATTLVEVTGTSTIGSYVILVDAVQAAAGSSSYVRQSGGSFNIFVIASSGTGGAINRIVGTKGSSNQRIDGDWGTGGKFKIQHKPFYTGGTGAIIPYRVKVQKVV